MVLAVCGLNHNSTPIEIREKIAYSFGCDLFLEQIEGVNGIAILSTCNRTEIYCDLAEDNYDIKSLFANLSLYPKDYIYPYLYTYKNEEIIRHMLRLASGLDSMMLGEPQILGQMKKCFMDACKKNLISKNLRHIFQFVFNATKKIRTKSGVGKNPISIAFAASKIIAEKFNNLENITIFIIGSGETASLVAKYLYNLGAKNFIIANRTKEHALMLAKKFNAEAISIIDLTHYLPKADVVISATSCPVTFINKNIISDALKIRQNAFMFLLDLSVPRDIEPDVATLDNICLYNIDNLNKIVDAGLKERLIAANIAEDLIEIKIKKFIQLQKAHDANSIISQYRDKMQVLANKELKRAEQKIASGNCQTEVMRELCNRLVNKLTHLPTISLRKATLNEQKDLLNFINNIITTYEKIT